jgi:hypothetical protein
MTKKAFLGAMAVVTAVTLTGTALVASNMGFKLNYTLSQAAVPSATNTLALPDNRQSGMTNATNLITDIGPASTFGVTRYLKASNSFETYRQIKGFANNFPLVPGEAYYVAMNTTVNYLPSHY